MKKLLMISMQYPYPRHCGFSVRLADMCDYLHQFFDIDILVNDIKHNHILHNENIFSNVFFQNNNCKKKNLFDRIKLKFSPPFFDDPYYINEIFINKVLQLHKMNSYDICMIHTPIFARCLYALPNNVFKVVDTHDIWFQKYSQFKKIGKEKILYHFRNKHIELDFYKKMDLVLAISKWDFKYLKNNGVLKSLYVPVSFSPQPLKNISNSNENYNILYPAGNGYHNIDALEFFINSVLPIVKKQFDNVKLLIPNPEIDFKNKYASNHNIVFLPFADKVDDLYQKADITVIPLRIKSGLKIKVLESFSFGIPTILSDAATQGIFIESYPQNNFSLNPDDFAAEVINALSSLNYRKQLSESALNIIKKHYSKDAVYSELNSVLSNV
jgi:glycosyltransferase involved in cell wall biosynthesis